MRAAAAARSSSSPVGAVDGPLGTLRIAQAFSVPLTVRFSALHTVFVALNAAFGALDTIFGTLTTAFGTLNKNDEERYLSSSFYTIFGTLNTTFGTLTRYSVIGVPDSANLTTIACTQPAPPGSTYYS